MSFEEVRKLLRAQPFRPFAIHVAGGGRIAVKHEDFAALAPTGLEMLVYLPNGSYSVVDLMQVRRLEILSKNGARKSHK